jgi:hypothetical protein
MFVKPAVPCDREARVQTNSGHGGLWEGPLRTLAAARGPPTREEESTDEPRELQLVLDPEYL